MPLHRMADHAHFDDSTDPSTVARFDAAFQLLVDACKSHGADFEAKDEFRRTALHRAAEAHLSGAVRSLLAAGADVDEDDPSGFTAMFFAADALRPEAEARAIATLAVLLDHGARPHVNTDSSTTAAKMMKQHGARASSSPAFHAFLKNRAKVLRSESENDTEGDDEPKVEQRPLKRGRDEE